MRPPPPTGRATLLAAWLAVALVVAAILTSCSSRRPTAYDWSLEPPGLALDHCARGLTEGGETVEVCASSRRACRYAVAAARRYGGSWLIRPADLQLARVDDCRRVSAEIDVQRVELP